MLKEIRSPRVEELLRAALRGDPIDWPGSSDAGFYDAFLSQAKYHGIESLICYLLRSRDAWDLIPTQVKDTLLNQLKIAVAFEMLRSKDLADLLKLLDLEGIPILILKGCAVAYTHYPAPYLRARCDTDIFIRPEDITTVSEILLNAGYEVTGQVYKSHQFNGYKTTFGGAVNYDVHWRSSNHAKYARVFGHEEAWREQVSVPGLDGAFALKPVHALLLACVHRAGNPGHDPDRLIWLYDIYLLVSAMSEAELLEFAQQAVVADIQAECREGIAKAGECFAFGIPEGVQELLSTPSRASSIRKRFADSTLGLITDDLRQLPNMHSRLALVREFLFPSGEYLLNRYQKKGAYWIPLLYFRYLLVGAFERITLR